MTILLHGENQIGLKNRLSQIKDNFNGEIVHLDGKTLTEELLSQNLDSNSLFQTGKKLIIIDSLLANKSFGEKTQNIDSNEVILTEGKKLTVTQIKTFQKLFPNLKEEEYKIDPVVFKFIDSLEPNNPKQNLKYWSTYCSSEVPEIIIVMLVRQIRLFLLAKEQNSDSSSDWAHLSPWQKQKLVSQSAKFTQDRLKSLFNQLAEIDLHSKTGQSPLDLKNSLELFLLRM